MTDVNLTTVGFDTVLQIEGTANLSSGERPLIVLLAEVHNNNRVIGQNLASALNLIDAGVVTLVGVEEFLSGDIVAQIAQDRLVQRFGGVAAYLRSIRDANGGDDCSIIAAVKYRPNNQLISFARYLVSMRPDFPVVGIEDPVLRQEAQKCSETIGEMFEDVADPVQCQQLRVRRFREASVERELKRDGAFLHYAMQAYRQRNLEGAILINGGGLHTERIAAQLQVEGRACLHIIPDGYADALA